MTYHINLYDPSLLRRREWLTATNLVIAVVGVCALMFAWGVWLRIDAADLAERATTLDARIKAAREETVALGAQLASRKSDPKLELDLAATRLLLDDREAILDELGRGVASTQIGYTDFLRGLARQSLGNLWLTGFSVGPGGMRMEIRGRTLDPALLPEYIRRLNAEPAFRGRRFANMSMTVPAPVPVPGTGANAAPASAAAPQAASPPWLEFVLAPEPEAARPGASQ